MDKEEIKSVLKTVLVLISPIAILAIVWLCVPYEMLYHW